MKSWIHAKFVTSDKVSCSPACFNEKKKHDNNFIYSTRNETMTQTSKQNLEKVLNHFILQDICNIALQEFPEITWEEIQNQNVQNNTDMLSKKNVIKIILNAVDHFSKEVIDERAAKLELYYIGQTETKTWNSYRLKDKLEDFNEKANKLECIKSAVRRSELMADVSVLKFRGKFIISAVKKVIRKRRGIAKSAPVYLQYFPFQSYIFISKGKFDSDLISAVVKGLGYKNYENCKLHGPKVRDLLTLLRNKEGGISSAELIEDEPDLDPEMRINNNVANYSQYAKRARYAEQLYGKNPPHLQEISFTVKNDTWNTFDAMEGTSIDGMEMSVHSANVIELFKEMMAKGILVTPMPPYIENILSAGRNKIKINPLK